MKDKIEKRKRIGKIGALVVMGLVLVVLIVPSCVGEEKLEEGNTKVSVNDSGDGYIALVEDGTEHMRLSGGNLGIGTISPQERLTLSSDSNFATEMAVPTGIYAIPDTGGSLPANTYYIKVVASDGVGTTIGSVEAYATVDGTTKNAIWVLWTASQGASSYRIYVGTSTGGQDRYHIDTASPFFLTAYGMDDGSTPGTVPAVTTAYVNKLAASGNSWIVGGNVGVGTINPGGILEVSHDGSSHDLFVDSSNGDVGIGTTDPQTKLHVEGTITVNQEIMAADSGGLHFATDDMFTRLLIDDSGYVGIWTIPSSLLHVSAGDFGDAELTLESDTDNNNEADNPFITFKQDGNNVNAFIALEGNSGVRSTNTLANALVIGSEDDNPAVQFVTNDIVRMTIGTGGNVGIGTAAPDRRLHVYETGEDVPAIKLECDTDTDAKTAQDLYVPIDVNGNVYYIRVYQ